MMSLNSAAGNFGMGIGSASGGAILLFSGFGLVGLSLGALGILATLIYLTKVQDTSKN
jgi:predicted MFS family arabinose efflux permease